MSPDLQVEHAGSAVVKLDRLGTSEVRALVGSSVIPAGAQTTTLDDEATHRVIEAADGLPLYVMLAIEVARETAAKGGVLEADLFGGPFAGMTENILRDLPEDERAALRGASLLRHFDASLAAIGGSVSNASGERLVRRSLVDDDGTSPLQYRVHDAIRAAIRATPGYAVGRWTHEDWSDAAARLIAALQNRHAAGGSVQDRLGLIVATWELAAESQLEADWLIRAALQDQPQTSRSPGSSSAACPIYRVTHGPAPSRVS